MVIIQLGGGLGNQMFQYALGRHVSLLNNQELKINTASYNNIPNHEKGVRAYGLSHFNITATQATPNNLEPFNKYIGSKLYARVMRKVSGLLGAYYNRPYIIEPPQDYHLFKDEILKRRFSGDICLEGFWFSEKYFKGIEKIIRQDFSFRDSPNEANKKLANEMRSTESVAIHVRRGDYLVVYANDILSIEYYATAAKKIVERIPGCRFYVFSDDPEWVEKNFRFGYPFICVDNNDDTKNYEDLRLMSSCKHHIIANSTFSWWGAWLGKSYNQIVFAPRFYRRGKDMSKTDYYPSDWNLL